MNGHDGAGVVERKTVPAWCDRLARRATSDRQRWVATPVVGHGVADDARGRWKGERQSRRLWAVGLAQRSSGETVVSDALRERAVAGADFVEHAVDCRQAGAEGRRPHVAVGGSERRCLGRRGDEVAAYGRVPPEGN